MITFKAYLEEASNIKKKWDIKKSNKKENLAAVEQLLKIKCSKSLKLALDGQLLWRGFTSGLTSKFAIIDSSDSVRVSKDSNNLYQLMLDTSPALKGYPSRSNSIICSTIRQDAVMYGDLYAVFPFDGTIIAGSQTDDFLYSNIKGSLLFDKISFDALNSNLDELFNGQCGIKPDKDEKYTDANYLNSKLSQFSTEQFLIILSIFYDGLGYFRRLPNIINLKKNYNVELFDIADMSNGAAKMRAIDKFIANIKDDPTNITPFGKKLMKMFSDRNNRFTVIASQLTPSTVDIKKSSINSPNALKSMKECWFSGKAVAVRYDLLNELFTKIENEDEDED